MGPPKLQVPTLGTAPCACTTTLTTHPPMLDHHDSRGELAQSLGPLGPASHGVTCSSIFHFQHGQNRLSASPLLIPSIHLTRKPTKGTIRGAAVCSRLRSHLGPPTPTDRPSALVCHLPLAGPVLEKINIPPHPLLLSAWATHPSPSPVIEIDHPISPHPITHTHTPTPISRLPENQLPGVNYPHT